MMGAAGDWPVVILRCGHVASVQEAMRQHGNERFCMYCACWVPVKREA